MDYMFLIYANEAEIAQSDPASLREIMGRHQAIHTEAAERGVLLSSGRLESSATAVTLAHRGGRTTATDGPFVETKEALGGYYLIACKDAEEALYWAGRIAETRPGLHVEMRALRPSPLTPSHA